MSTHPSLTVPATENVFRRLSYLLVFLMLACGVLTLDNLIRSAAPGWHAGVLAAVLLFIVIDRMVTHAQIKDLTPLSSEWLFALGAQWIVIALVLRLLLSYANGLEAFRADVSRFARGDLLAVLSPEFVFAFLVAALIWYVTGYFLSLLDEMGLDQKLALSEETMQLRSNIPPARERLVNLIFSVGIVLVVLTAVARVNWQSVLPAINRQSALEFNRLSGGEAGALLYFAFGLALLSLGRLISLQTRWMRQRIPISSQNLTRQWGVYSVVFLLGLALVISILPAGDSVGLFAVLSALLGFLFNILFFIGQLILLLVSLLFSLPLALLQGETAPSMPEPPPLPVMPNVEPGAPITTNETWMLLRSAFLWGALALLIVLASIHFVRQHGGVRAALRHARVTNWLLLAWQWLYRGAEKTRESLARVLTESWQNLVSRLDLKGVLPRATLLKVRALDPRRRIYFFYLAMIRRGGELGVTRHPSQSPAEYAVTLRQALPPAEDDVDSITEAFIQARYTRQEIDDPKADSVKTTWGRIRRKLQEKSKAERSRNDNL